MILPKAPAMINDKQATKPKGAPRRICLTSTKVKKPMATTRKTDKTAVPIKSIPKAMP